MAYTLEIKHERFMDDRWQVMLRVNRVAFAIGSPCHTIKNAQDVRTEFMEALRVLTALPDEASSLVAKVEERSDGPVVTIPLRRSDWLGKRVRVTLIDVSNAAGQGRGGAAYPAPAGSQEDRT
ncbi:MAG: hypothetical protein WCL44_08970 [bacterium]